MQRLDTLKRLMTLYGVVEEQHSMELQRTVNAVREVGQAIEVQHDLFRSAKSNGRAALHAGDRMEWAMAEAQRETTVRRRRRLDELRLEREQISSVTKEQYVASQLKCEQMKSVVDHIEKQRDMEFKRKTQAVSDDRFLARRRWTDARGKLRVAEVKKT